MRGRTMTKTHIPFPSIGGFANMIKYRDRFRSRTDSAYFGTKIKLHGTNGAVRINSQGIVAQSRKRDLKLGSDNYGFAQWVEKRKDYFKNVVTDERTVLIYGEWAGQGVQQTVAVSKAPKAFYIFAIAVLWDNQEKRQWILEPNEIENFVQTKEDMFILPWFSKNHKVDFNNPQLVADFLNEEVAKIDEVDPYIKELHGIEAVGEGLVGYNLDDPNDTGFWFKVKGAKHTVNDEAKIAKVKKRAGQEYHDLAEAFLTEGRFQQAMTDSEHPLVFEKQWIGKFLSWVMQDIQKESEDERRELDIEWRLWAGILSKGAREWFLAKCDEV